MKPPTHRRRGTHTKARRHEETEARRDGGADRIGVRLSLFHSPRGSLYPLRSTMKETKPDPNPHEDTKARRHEETEEGEALGCTPCEAAHPPPARDAHEGTKARRDGGANRIGVRLSLFHFHRGSLCPLRQTMKETTPDPTPGLMRPSCKCATPARRGRAMVCSGPTPPAMTGRSSPGRVTSGLRAFSVASSRR